MKKTKLVTLTAPTRDTTHSSSEVIIQLPVPYELPPLPYSSDGGALLLSCSKWADPSYRFSNIHFLLQMCPGLGTDDILRKMIMVKFGLGCKQFKIDGILSVHMSWSFLPYLIQMW